MDWRWSKQIDHAVGPCTQDGLMRWNGPADGNLRAVGDPAAERPVVAELLGDHDLQPGGAGPDL